MPVIRPIRRRAAETYRRVPLALVSDPDRLRAALTVVNKAVRQRKQRGFAVLEGQLEEVATYIEDGDVLLVPRAFDARPYLKIAPPLPGRSSAPPLPEALPFERPRLAPGERLHGAIDKVTLGPNDRHRYDQRPAFAALTAPSPHGGKVLSLGCGRGKTVLALKAAYALGGRFLWVTNTTDLVDQTFKAIEACLGLTKAPSRRQRLQPNHVDHGREPYVGHVQAAKEDWQGRSCAVASLATLAKRELPQAFYEWWDLVIFDEGDVLGAPYFGKVVPRFRGERWVLTATPKRADGMEALYHLHVGPICYEDTESDLVPECYFVNTGRQTKVGYAGWDKMKHARRFSYALTARNLLQNGLRNDVVIGEIQKALDKGREVLVVGDSVEGIGVLAAQAKAKGLDVGVVTSRVKRKDRVDGIHNHRVSLATMRIMRGVDRPTWDTLIIATLAAANDTVMKQGIGRVLRFVADSPDKRPIVVVLVDPVDELHAMTAKLALRFKRWGWPVGGIAQQLIDEAKRKAADRRDAYRDREEWQP